MLKLYHAPSPNPAKIVLFMEEAGAEYEIISVNTRKGEQHTPEFLCINPNAKTPVVADGDTIIFDSNAILLYLSAKFQKFAFDAGSEHHAQMLSWLMFVASGIGPYTGQAVHFKLVAPEPKEYALNRYMFESNRHWAIVDERLSSRDYMVGDTYSIVDMSLWGWARTLDRAFGPDTWSKFPAVARFVERVNERPAAQRAASIHQSLDFKQGMDDEAKRNLFRHG